MEEEASICPKGETSNESPKITKLARTVEAKVIINASGAKENIGL